MDPRPSSSQTVDLTRRRLLELAGGAAYGLGDRTVGPLWPTYRRWGGIACVRPEEAISGINERLPRRVV